MAAAELRDYSDSPALWPRIHQALAQEAAATAQQRERWSWRSLFPNLSISWQTATAAVFIAALMISAGWLLKPKLPMQQGTLLRSKALTEVESAESASALLLSKVPCCIGSLGFRSHPAEIISAAMKT